MRRDDLQMGKPRNEAGVRRGVEQLRKASQRPAPSIPPPDLPDLPELPGDDPLDTQVELRGPRRP